MYLAQSSYQCCHGQTQFAITTAAFQLLYIATQKKLEKLRAIHCMVFPKLDFMEMPENTPPVSQPLVKQNDYTQEKFLS